MTRILYVITRSIMGGAQRHVLELANGFKDRHDVSVALGAHGFLTEQLDAAGIPYHVLPDLQRSINPFSDVKATLALRRLMKDIRPDIVHAHSAKAGLVARLAARLAGVRSIYSVHGWAFDKGVSLGQRAVVWPVEAVSALFSDVVMFSTRYDRDYARRSLPVRARKLVIVPYGVEAEAPQSTPGDAVDRPAVIMVARFSDQKDQPTLLRAAALLDDLDFRLVLVGDGPNMARDQALAAELNLGDKAEFLGSRDDVNDLYTAMHVFVLCTNYEGLPLSIMEAMRAGLPVVATDVSGVAEEIDDGVTGFLADHKDHAMVAEKLRLLIADPALRGRMGAAAGQKFRTEFTKEVMLARMGAVYDDVIAGGTGGGS